MTKLSLRILYVCSGHHLRLGQLKQRTPQQQKRARLERRIAEVRRQLAQLRENLEKLLAEEAQPASDTPYRPLSGRLAR
jgi:hypothetical protein